MKRFLPFILIFSVVLQFFAPFTIGVTNKNITKNIVRAEQTNNDVSAENISIQMKITPVVTNRTISLKVEIPQDSKVVDYLVSTTGMGAAYTMIFYLEATAYDSKGNKASSAKSDSLSHKNLGTPFNIELKRLNPKTSYDIKLDLFRRIDTGSGIGREGIPTRILSQQTTVSTSDSSDTKTLEDESFFVEAQTPGLQNKSDGLPECGFFTIGGCVARVFYYVLFVPTSFLFGLAGKAMDFTIMYSVSDSSYRTPFVSEGWQVVRDLCNMFFIFILLYIALTTILDSGGSKNKNGVVNVIIIGLLINFSLFATHLIIDASNIMARVFYNPKVIVIGEKDTSGEINNTQDEGLGHIRLSEGIVSKINPQRLLLQENQNVASDNAQKITTRAGIRGEDNGISAGTFILVTIMASIVNFVGMMTFLTISLSFIGRVIGLWIAMVLSPLAFLSYTVPETKNWSYVGWSSWWSETTKAAFMAPVFVFFMYIIVMFLESNMGLNLLTKSSSLTDFNKVLSVIIPFIVIIVLLKQAEKISTKLAGEVAGVITSKIGNIGGKVGGLALGGALGLGAFAMRSTVGKMGASIANSEKLQNAEAKGGVSGWGARQLRNIGSFTGKSSFDARNTDVVKKVAKEAGAENLGKGKTGGYVDYQSRVEKKKTERAETLKSSDAEAAKQDAAAKEYNDNYQRSMYAKKREVENSGGTFNEEAYKEEYKNNIKEQEKNERIQELARKGKSFDQKQQDKFEKEYTEKHKNDGKTSDQIYREKVQTYRESVKRDGVWGANNSTMTRIDKNLKDKSKDPDAEKPVTHKENFLAEKNKLRAENKAEEVEKTIEKMRGRQEDIANEMEDINKDLEDVANILGQPIAIADINKEHIKQAMEKVNESVSEAEARIISLSNILAQNPGNQVAQRELAEANKTKRDGEAKIKNISSALDRKDKNKEKETTLLANIEKQESIIAKQKEIIEKEQETIDKYEKQQQSSS